MSECLVVDIDIGERSLTRMGFLILRLWEAHGKENSSVQVGEKHLSRVCAISRRVYFHQTKYIL